MLLYLKKTGHWNLKTRNFRGYHLSFHTLHPCEWRESREVGLLRTNKINKPLEHYIYCLKGTTYIQPFIYEISVSCVLPYVFVLLLISVPYKKEHVTKVITVKSLFLSRKGRIRLFCGSIYTERKSITLLIDLVSLISEVIFPKS